MATFPSFTPRHGWTRNRKQRALVAQFGDGYSQRAGDGINVRNDEWQVVFTLPIADAQIIEDFLVARGGHDSFDWTPPRESTAKKWICTEWSRQQVAPNADELSATFIEVHEA